MDYREPLRSLLSAIADLEDMTRMFKEIGMTTDEMEKTINELRRDADALKAALEDGLEDGLIAVV